MPRKRLRFPSGIPRQEVKSSPADDLTSDTLRSGMSDKSPLSNIDLRDRLVRAIQLSNTVLYPNEWHPIADSIIKELGLRQETVYAWKNGRTYPAGTRYVSEWERNE